MSFVDRAQALEDEFFAAQDAELLRQLRDEHRSDDRHAALAAASGISDESTLAALDSLGVNPTTLSALQLIPLIAVAWADGQIQTAERNAILAAAEDSGIGGGRAARKLLMSWLENKPGPALVEAWVGYAAGMVENLTPEAAAVMRRTMLQGARDVASAAGGILGLASISAEESAVLERLAAAIQ